MLTTACCSVAGLGLGLDFVICLSCSLIQAASDYMPVMPYIPPMHAGTFDLLAVARIHDVASTRGCIH